MNAEQLHSVCEDVKREIEATAVIKKLKQLENALQQSISAPADVSHQETVSNLRYEIDRVLLKVEDEDRSALKRIIIDEIGGSELLGRGLHERMEESFTQIDVTPSLVQRDIAAMRQELETFLTGLNELIASFTKFDIGADELPPYSAELGVLIPRADADTRLRDLYVDLRKLNDELQVFQELVTGQSGNFRVRAISSSEYQFFLSMLPDVALKIGGAIWALMLAYDKLLDIRIKRQDFVDKKAPKNVTDAIDKWAENSMGEEIERIAKELIEQHKDVNRPAGRVHEIETALRIRLKRMAGRLDVGYHYSVRVGELPEPAAEEEDEEAQAERAKQSEVINAIQKAASNIEFRELPGNPVLPLEWRPESDALEDEKYTDADDTEGAPRKKKGPPKRASKKTPEGG